MYSSSQRSRKRRLMTSEFCTLSTCAYYLFPEIWCYSCSGKRPMDWRQEADPWHCLSESTDGDLEICWQDVQCKLFLHHAMTSVPGWEKREQARGNMLVWDKVQVTKQRQEGVSSRWGEIHFLCQLSACHPEGVAILKMEDAFMLTWTFWCWCLPSVYICVGSKAGAWLFRFFAIDLSVLTGQLLNLPSRPKLRRKQWFARQHDALEDSNRRCLKKLPVESICLSKQQRWVVFVSNPVHLEARAGKLTSKLFDFSPQCPVLSHQPCLCSSCWGNAEGLSFLPGRHYRAVPCLLPCRQAGGTEFEFNHQNTREQHL